MSCCTTDGYVNKDGVELYYVIKHQAEKSADPTIVFVHGNDSDSSVWICQQNFFCERYKTLAIDMRGFGKSSKPQGPLTISIHCEDLRYTLKKLGIKHIYLVGWSTGGAVTQLYTLRHPKQVIKLCLVSTTPQAISDEKFPYGLTFEQYLEILSTITFNFPKYVINGAEATIPETCPKANLVRDRVAEDIINTGKKISFRQTLDNGVFSVTDKLKDIVQPTLIFVGAKDGVINPNASFFLRQHIPNSHIVEFSLAGHAPFLTFKDEFNEALLNFLNGYNMECQICNLYVDEEQTSG